MIEPVEKTLIRRRCWFAAIGGTQKKSRRGLVRPTGLEPVTF